MKKKQIKEGDKISKCPICGREGYNEGEECVYERLSPGDVLIISRQEDSFLVAENHDGDIRIRKVSTQ